MRRTARLFAIAERLRARRTGVTAEELAEAFGVSVRTIFRDLDALRQAELPLRAERGRGGGLSLDRSYSLPPVSFTAREAAVLLSGCRWLAQMRVLPFTSTLDRALDKVQGALDRTAQRELLGLLETLHYVGVPALPSRAKVRAAVEQAWFEGQLLHVRYDGRDGTSERTLRIRTIVMERSQTLLNCDDLDQGKRRQFRLDRILQARVVPSYPGDEV